MQANRPTMQITHPGTQPGHTTVRVQHRPNTHQCSFATTTQCTQAWQLFRASPVTQQPTFTHTQCTQHTCNTTLHNQTTSACTSAHTRHTGTTQTSHIPTGPFRPAHNIQRQQHSAGHMHNINHQSHHSCTHNTAGNRHQFTGNKHSQTCHRHIIISAQHPTVQCNQRNTATTHAGRACKVVQHMPQVQHMSWPRQASIIMNRSRHRSSSGQCRHNSHSAFKQAPRQGIALKPITFMRHPMHHVHRHQHSTHTMCMQATGQSCPGQHAHHRCTGTSSHNTAQAHNTQHMDPINSFIAHSNLSHNNSSFRSVHNSHIGSFIHDHIHSSKSKHVFKHSSASPAIITSPHTQVHSIIGHQPIHTQYSGTHVKFQSSSQTTVEHAVSTGRSKEWYLVHSSHHTVHQTFTHKHQQATFTILASANHMQPRECITHNGSHIHGHIQHNASMRQKHTFNTALQPLAQVQQQAHMAHTSTQRQRPVEVVNRVKNHRHSHSTISQAHGSSPHITASTHTRCTSHDAVTNMAQHAPPTHTCRPCTAHDVRFHCHQCLAQCTSHSHTVPWPNTQARHQCKTHTFKPFSGFRANSVSTHSSTYDASQSFTNVTAHKQAHHQQASPNILAAQIHISHSPHNSHKRAHTPCQHHQAHHNTWQVRQRLSTTHSSMHTYSANACTNTQPQQHHVHFPLGNPQ